MTTTKDIVATSRTFVGAPFVFQGRAIATGVDCVGLLIGVAAQEGLCDREGVPITTDRVIKRYRQRPEPLVLMRELKSLMEEAPDLEPRIGTVLVFGFQGVRGALCHCGIVVDRPRGVGIIHASNSLRRVVEHLLDDELLSHARAAFLWPGVSDD